MPRVPVQDKLMQSHMTTGSTFYPNNIVQTDNFDERSIVSSASSYRRSEGKFQRKIRELQEKK